MQNIFTTWSSNTSLREAPEDGRAYVRRDKDWAPIPLKGRAQLTFDPDDYDLPAPGDPARVAALIPAAYADIHAARAAYGVPWLEAHDTQAYAAIQGALWAAYTWGRRFRLQIDGVPQQGQSDGATVQTAIDAGSFADLAAARAQTGVADLATTDERRWADLMATVVAQRADAPAHTYSAIEGGGWTFPPEVAYLGHDLRVASLRDRTLGDLYAGVGEARTALGLDAAALDGLGFQLADNLGWAWFLGRVWAYRATLSAWAREETRGYSVVKLPPGEWVVNRALEIGLRTKLTGTGKKETRLRLLHPVTVAGAVDTAEGITLTDHLADVDVREDNVLRSFHALEATSLYAWRSAINGREMPAEMDPVARASFTDDGGTTHRVEATASNQLTVDDGAGGAVVPASIKRNDFVVLSAWSNPADARTLTIKSVSGNVYTVETAGGDDPGLTAGGVGTAAFHFENRSILNSLWQPTGYRTDVAAFVAAGQADRGLIGGAQGNINLTHVGISVKEMTLVGAGRRFSNYSRYDQPVTEYANLHLVCGGWTMDNVLSFDSRGPGFFIQATSPPQQSRVQDVLGVFANTTAVVADEDADTAGGTLEGVDFNPANTLIDGKGLPKGWEDDAHMIAEGLRFGCVYDGRSTLGDLFRHAILANGREAFPVEDSEIGGEFSSQRSRSFGHYVAGNDMNAASANINPRSVVPGDWQVPQLGMPAATQLPLEYRRHQFGTIDVDDPRPHLTDNAGIDALCMYDPLPDGADLETSEARTPEGSGSGSSQLARTHTVATLTDGGAGGEIAIGDSDAAWNPGDATNGYATVTLSGGLTLPRVVRERTWVTFASGWGAVAGRQLQIVAIGVDQRNGDRTSFVVRDDAAAIAAESVAAGGTLTFQNHLASTITADAGASYDWMVSATRRWRGRHYFEATLEADGGQPNRWLVGLVRSDATLGGQFNAAERGFALRNRGVEPVAARTVDAAGTEGYATPATGSVATVQDTAARTARTIGLLYDADAGLVYVASGQNGQSEWLTASGWTTDFASAQGFAIGNAHLPLVPGTAVSDGGAATFVLGPRDAFEHGAILPADTLAWDEAATVESYRQSRGRYATIRWAYNQGIGHIHGPTGARYGTFHAAGTAGPQYWFSQRGSYTVRWMEIDNINVGPVNWTDDVRGAWTPDFSVGEYAGFDDTLHPIRFGLILEDICAFETRQLFTIKTMQSRIEGMGEGRLPPDGQTIPLDCIASIGRPSPGRSHEFGTHQAADTNGISIRRTGQFVHLGNVHAKSDITLKHTQSGGSWNPTGLADWATIKEAWFAQTGLAPVLVHLGQTQGSVIRDLRAAVDDEADDQWAAFVLLKGRGKLVGGELTLGGYAALVPVLRDSLAVAETLAGVRFSGTLVLTGPSGAAGLIEQRTAAHAVDDAATSALLTEVETRCHTLGLLGTDDDPHAPSWWRVG